MSIVTWEFESPPLHIYYYIFIAEIAQLVEHNLAKVGVASSSLVFRSETQRTIERLSSAFFSVLRSG